MRVTRALRWALVSTLAVAGCGAEPAARSTSPRDLAAKAAGFLWSKQAKDGGWHSETYGLMRSGQALTPFVLSALLEAAPDASTPPAGAVERALSFLRAHVSDGGSLGENDPDFLEYPTYATAYAIRCFVLAGRPSDRALVARMADFLVRGQYREENGFRPTDPAYGGWGFGGKKDPGVPGHMDLAHTRRALEALRAAGRVDPQVIARAETFLRVVQNRRLRGALVVTPLDDDGFYFSPVVLPANKGAAVGFRYGSYATATCDGLLALLAAGVPLSDARVERARDWLRRFPEADPVPGIPLDQPTPWAPSLFHYHLAVRAEVERALGDPPSFRVLSARLLAPRQRPDGSFVGSSALMKEDDPLIATTLALIALR